MTIKSRLSRLEREYPLDPVARPGRVVVVRAGGV